MPTIKFDGRLLYQKLNSQFASINEMIENSKGALSRGKRSAIYRAFEGRPVDTVLAESIAKTLGTTVSMLTAGHHRPLRFSSGHQAFNAALQLLRKRLGTASSGQTFRSWKSTCVADWLRHRIEADDSVFQLVLDELARIGYLQRSRSGQWIHAFPSLDAVTHSLRRRVQFQWPIVRDIFCESLPARRRTSRALTELIKFAESEVTDPLTFFCVDDQIHESICKYPVEAEMIRSSRSASWGIAYDLMADLSAEMQTNAQSASRSMKSIASWMIEDYAEWAYRLAKSEIGSLKTIERSFRRHVLRMRDYAQYYRSDERVQGDGKSSPGSEVMC